MSTQGKVGKPSLTRQQVKEDQKLGKVYEKSQDGIISEAKSQSANAQAYFIPPTKPREDQDAAADQPVQAQSATLYNRPTQYP